jgi:4'-phosphopantetheinyl transferase EntD
VWRRTCTETERLRLEALPQARAVELGTWAFCAKEATYKCLYPQSRVWLGLRDVEVELDPEAGRFTAVPVRDVPPFASAGQELSGRLGALGERVFAALVLPA